MDIAPKDVPPEDRPRRWSLHSIFLHVAIVLLLLAIGHLLLASQAGYRYGHTCVICRLQRTDYVWQYWWPTVTYHETTCSKWYPAHVEPDHEHVWARGSTTGYFDFYGRIMAVGDNFDSMSRAIHLLTPDQQISIYQHFSDPDDAKAVFVSLIDPAIREDRTDLVIVRSLRAWIESGFAGAWALPDPE